MKSISKTSYVDGLQCMKTLWLKTFKSGVATPRDKATQEKFDAGHEVGGLAKLYFGVKDAHDIKIDHDNRSKSIPLAIQKTKQLIASQAPNIAEATFVTNDTFCSVDILRVYPNGEVDIVEVKSTTSVKPQHYDDVAFQYYVLTKNGYKVNKAYLMHLNNQYVRQGDLDIQQLFTLVDITENAKNLQSKVCSNIPTFLIYSRQFEEPSMPVGKHCSNPYPCKFYEYCWKDIEVLPKQFDDNKDVEMIQEFLNTLSYPLYFLDFETYQVVVPPYDNCRPYQQIPFQYSLHIAEKPVGARHASPLRHTEFLAENILTDPRRALAEQLCNDIPRNACVVAYNMTFEKGVIKEMANVFVDLEEHLMSIHDNMKDLMKPFRISFGKHVGAFYCQDMQGSYSIKYVLPALCPDMADAYEKLPLIRSGDDAMTIFPTLHLQTSEEQKKIRQGLLEYCKLDTFAMVKVLEKVQEMVN